VIQEIFSVAHLLSIQLQKVNFDLASVIYRLLIISVLIKEFRSNVHSKCHDLFNTTEQLAKEIEEEIKIPMVTHRHAPRIFVWGGFKVSFFPYTQVNNFYTYVYVRLYHVLIKLFMYLSNKLIKSSENEIKTSIELMLKQWPIVVSSCGKILKEVLL